MRYSRTVFVLILIVLVSTAYGSLWESSDSSTKEPHQFSRYECQWCHSDIANDARHLRSDLGTTCESCHTDINQSQSHPVDIIPKISVPVDMPLGDGRLNCITCHFAHPFSIRYKRFSHSLLRRPGKGVAFCSTCHGIEKEGHRVFENAHLSSYQLTNLNGTLDLYTLQCVECHDKYLDKPSGARSWLQFSSHTNHPVGVSLARIAVKNPSKFNPAVFLPKEIRLFNGKIGCGTCHNVYSKEKFMLVMSNQGSKLCMECHVM